MIFAGLVAASFLWGGNNVATKHLIDHWPPIWTTCTRFFMAGGLLLALARYTSWFGAHQPISPGMKRALWFRGSLSFTAYILCFIWALRWSSAANMGLLFATSPLWALLWEIRQVERPELLKRLMAATLTLSGVLLLCWSSLEEGASKMAGNLLGLAASILWTHYSRVCRDLGQHLSSAQLNGHHFVRTCCWLLPLAVYDQVTQPIPMSWQLWASQGYSVVGAGIFAFALWTHALKHWPTSRVMLFVNLIPLTTLWWGWVLFGEQVDPSFWGAMVLVILGVLLGWLPWPARLSHRLSP